MRYVVFGAAGQLGQEIARLLGDEVFRLSRVHADLTQPQAVRAVLTLLQPDVVVNCAAYNFVDRAEEELEVAHAVNGTAVGELAEVCKKLGSVLVHFSTDHVFGGGGGSVPFREEATPAPVNAYGRSKRVGEELLLSRPGLRYLLIRTCGLYGAHGSGGKGCNFVEAVLRQSREGQQLRVVSDQCCTPSCARDVAQATVTLLARETCGLFHLTNTGSCSWHEFARTILELEEIHADLKAITSAELCSRARRPAFSVLENAAWQRLGLSPLRPWQEALRAYLEERRGEARGVANAGSQSLTHSLVSRV
jgi:dTDP-4-dehydrorhamnose reductase